MNGNGYDTFIYKNYEIKENKTDLKITYHFEIPGLKTFHPTLEIPKKVEKKVTPFVESLVFHIGLIELISYWKCCCPKNVMIQCGKLEEEQIDWFKKLYFLGLGEFFYRNNLNPNEQDFMNIKTMGKVHEITSEFHGTGSMIAVGGGKDSCVSLELLKQEENCSCFMINPKEPMLACANIAGIKEVFQVKRTIDKELIELNNQGFLNGHTPFSSLVAFTAFLTAFLNDKEYIVLSNEASANEATIKDTKINHQYSKSYEFEQDFNRYVNKYLKTNIHYFSFLRPLNEYQIGMLLSKFKNYHEVFKSCNPGSKQIPWAWCNHCAKCLFTYSMLSPFLYKEDLVNIFKEDLFEKTELLSTFQELLGYKETKPFDCVGTTYEINYAITKTIANLEGEELPYLLKYYKEHYLLTDITQLLEKDWNPFHNLPPKFETILKEAIKK